MIGETKVCELEGICAPLGVLVVQDILGLDVPVAVTTIVQVVQGTQNLLENLHAEAIVGGAPVLASREQSEIAWP